MNVTTYLASFVPNRLVQCNGKQINCTYMDGKVDGDPEIAGIGVVISFIVASLITLVSIIFGYLTYSIDEKLTNGLDAVVVEKMRRLLYMRSGGNIDPGTKSKRKEVLTRFILSLSDQQLVTGLAILITGYYSRCDMSGYHFSIVATLAWFSSITHLSTLAVLHEYFVRHPVVKTWRFLGMVCLMGLLFHAQLYNQWFIIPSLPVQCSFAAGFPGLKKVDLPGFAFVEFITSTQWLAIVGFLFFSYANNLVRLYVKGPGFSVLSWIDESLRDKHNLQTPESRLECLEKATQKYIWDNPARLVIAYMTFVLQEFLHSFLWEIIWLIFGNVFGLTQLYEARWKPQPPIVPGEDDFLSIQVVGSENSMGFGQLVALLLMTLPLLAAGEAYYDVKVPDASSNDEQGTIQLQAFRPGSSEPWLEASARGSQTNPYASGTVKSYIAIIAFVVTGYLVVFALSLSYLIGSYPSPAIFITWDLTMVLVVLGFGIILSTFSKFVGDLARKLTRERKLDNQRKHDLPRERPP